MAPPKVLNAQTRTTSNVINTNVTGVVTRRGSLIRQQSGTLHTILPVQKQTIFSRETSSRAKRKADSSPVKDKASAKRSALGNITNAIGKTISAQIQDAKKVTKKIAVNQTSKNVTQNSTLKNLDRILARAESNINRAQLQKQVGTRASKPLVKLPAATEVESKVVTETKPKKEVEKTEIPSKTIINRRSLDLEKSDDSSLYVSALESLPEENVRRSSRSTTKEIAKKTPKVENKIEIQFDTPPEEVSARVDCNPPPLRSLPRGVEWDFDVENWQDIYQVSHYASDIFDYLKNREELFLIDDYLSRQVYLSTWMRSLLVDWMVAVQESFELNHETLYLGVKLVDLYLTKVPVGKETLQLLGAASLFIASKYDERIPPMVEDFLYICDGAYTHRELTKMEISVLKVMDFDLGIPISYRFLRRYARCAKVSMPTLTLARYILEYSLMDYSIISLSDSKMAAAALYLALQMKDLGGWTTTLEFYTGYKLEEFKDVVIILNDSLHKKYKDSLSTVKHKYSHNIFFSVAKTPLKQTGELVFS